MLGYWRFYWPLALTGMALVLSTQFQNGVLARYPDAVTELAVFALASGIYGFVHSSLTFMSQLSNVFARSHTGTKRCWRFVALVSLGLMGLLLVVAATPFGYSLVRSIYGIDADITQRVCAYLVLLTGVVFLHGQRHFFTGLLVQARLTGWVTLVNFAYLGLLFVGLALGLSQGLPAPWVLVGADAVAATLQIGLLIWVWRVHYQLPEPKEHETLTYKELTTFFVPVSTTGVMFALSRPILFALVTRTPEGLPAVAALRVAFDFSAMFQQATNQFRHFFVTFGWADLAIKRRFMWLVGLGMTGLMLSIALTPLSSMVWGDLMGLPNELTKMAVEAFVVLCLMPAFILWRNYYHGYLMVVRRTAGMAWASILRVVGIYLYAQLLLAVGWLDHVTAAIGLILGFCVEAVVVRAIAQRQMQQRD